MKFGIIILMIIILMAHAFSYQLIYISFKMNQEYIVANLCVQKNEPVNTCHGHCQLTNKMQDHEKQKNDFPLIQDGWINFCFLRSANRFIFKLMLSQVRDQKIFTSSFYTSVFIHNIFHPPK